MSEALGDFDDLLDGVGRVHPEDVTDVEKAETAAQRGLLKQKAMRAKIYHLFTTGDGPAVLDWLKTITIDRAVLPFETIMTMNADQRAAHAAHREGENEVVRNIILAIQDHERGEDHEEATEPD